MKAYFEDRLKSDLLLYKDFHAQFVELGKNCCKRTNPLCEKCPLVKICSLGVKTAQKER
jgi:endonuclease-3 related protein